MPFGLFSKKIACASTYPFMLRAFADELNRRMLAADLSPCNGPGCTPIEFELEMNEQSRLMGETNVHFVYTTKGLIPTKTPLENNEIVITVASTADIDAHFLRLGEIALERKRINCIGFCAAAYHFGREIIETDPDRYSSIKINICALKNWGHFFIELTDSEDQSTLFYEPWYQHCQNKETAPFLFDRAEDYADRLRDAIHELSEYNIFHHMEYLTPYNSVKQILSNSYQINLNDDFEYQRIFSSTIPKPKYQYCVCS